MTSFINQVDMKTNIAGENRMELLMFYLSSQQRYGINVFKVKEVYFDPDITMIPGRHPACIGVTNFRGVTIPVIDLARAMNLGPLPDTGVRTIITTEYNRTMQGLIVGRVDKIINKPWPEVQVPPPGIRNKSGSYINAITEVEEKLVEIIDVEMILEQITPCNKTIDDKYLECESLKELRQKQYEVFIIDDSAIARKKLKNTLEALGLVVTQATTGLEALNMLKKIASEGVDINEKFLFIVSDIEMPEMDGYTFVREVRQDPRLESLYIAMHSSMSGQFNEGLISKVGANKFIPKFHPDDFASIIEDVLQAKGLV